MLRKLFIITKCDLSQEGKGGLKQENENLIKWGGVEKTCKVVSIESKGI